MTPSRSGRAVAAAAALALAALWLPADEKAEKKKDSVKDTAELAGEWIYDDLPAAVAQAKQTGKPIWVVFR